MFLWKPNLASPLEEEVARRTPWMSASKFFGLSLSHAFERSNTAGLLLEDTRIARAEKEAGTFDDMWWIGGLTGTPETNRNALSEEDFKAKGYDRNGKIAYTPRTTEQRAQIEAEVFDRREYEKQLLERENTGAWRVALGLGAGLLASLPDPVNLIPVGGTLSKGASMGRRVLSGAKSGALGTVVADAFLMPESARRGEDVGFSDLALDVTFGALLGAGIGGVGGILHNRRVKGLSSERRLLEGVLTDAGYNQADARRLSSSTVEFLADMGDRATLSQTVRQNLAGLDRINAGRLLDRTMLALERGERLDIGRWAEEMGARRSFEVAERIQSEQSALASGYDRVRDNPLVGSPDEVLATLEPEDIERVLVHHGPAVLKGGEIKVQGNPLKNAGFSKRGFGLVKIIFAHGEKGNKTPDMPPVSKEDVLSIPRFLREYEPIIQEHLPAGDGITRWNIPREDGKHLAIVVGRGQDGPDSRLVSVFVDDPQKNPTGQKNPALILPSRRKSGEGDTGQGISSFTPDSQSGKEGLPSASSIGRQSLSVNERPLDFSAPEPEPRITPPTLEESARLEQEAARAEAGSALDVEATRLVAEGKISKEDKADWETAQQEIGRADALENAGLSIMECVTGGMA